MKVAFIDMPFFLANSCSAGLALMKAYLNQIDIKSDTFYFNLDFSVKIGIDNYRKLERHNYVFDANWVFTDKVFNLKNSLEYLSKTNSDPVFLYHLKQRCNQYITELSSQDWSQYDIIAFSSTFPQLNASLALGRAIKEKNPRSLIVYGGCSVANVYGIELMKNFDWMDVVFLGEADRSFPEFCQLFTRDNSLDKITQIKGIAVRQGKNVRYSFDPDNIPMNEVIAPNYDDYIKAIQPYKQYFSPVTSKRRVCRTNYEFSVGFEFSRGCKYGSKKCCKFCSFSESIGFRSTECSVEKALQFFEVLYSKYAHEVHFVLCDNFLPSHYPEKVFKTWSLRRKELNIPSACMWLETMPWCSKSDVKHIYDVGVDALYLGIEHLHPKAIISMDKGHSINQALAVLKWCKFYGLLPEWNCVYQIPDEDKAWYDDMIDLIPKICHLLPPNYVVPIGIRKESPYWTDKEKYNFPNLRYFWEYDYIFPPQANKDVLAYYYYYSGWGSKECYKEFFKCIDYWNERYYDHDARLVFENNQIKDSRNGEEETITISQIEKNILEFCDTARTKRQIDKKFGDQQKVLDLLVAKKIILAADSRYLTLVENLECK